MFNFPVRQNQNYYIKSWIITQIRKGLWTLVQIDKKKIRKKLKTKSFCPYERKGFAQEMFERLTGHIVKTSFI